MVEARPWELKPAVWGRTQTPGLLKVGEIVKGASALVVGGGPAGLAAALSLARGGVRVHLVEKAAQLGGHARLFGCKAVDTCQKCNLCRVHLLLRELGAEEKVTVHLESPVLSLKRVEDGRFWAELGRGTTPGQGAGPGENLVVDTVILATGYEPFDARQKPNLGYGFYDQVMTTYELEQALCGGADLGQDLLASGVKRVAFVQCVGSRDKTSGQEYCSRVCCQTSLRMARVVRDYLPEAQIDIFYMDFQGLGKDAYRVKEQAERQEGINFIRSMPSKIWHLPSGGVQTRYEDLEKGSTVKTTYDLVFLAVGMGPNPAAPSLVVGSGLVRTAEGFFRADPESPACTGVEGVFVAGACCGPMDIAEAIAGGQEVVLEAFEYLKRKRGDSSPVSATVTGVDGQASRRDEAGPVVQRVAVLGAGLGGLEASLLLEEAGLEVLLLESAPAFGHSGSSPDGSALQDRIRRVRGAGGIQVLFSTEVTGLEGGAKNYLLSYRGPCGQGSARVGAVVVAPPARRVIKPDWGLPGSPRVVGLNKACLDGIGPNGTLVVWADPGERTEPGIFREALKFATEGARLGATVFLLGREARVAADSLEREYAEAREAGVLFIKYTGEGPRLRPEKAAVEVVVEDPTLAGSGRSPVVITADQVVVAESVQAEPYFKELAARLRVNLGPDDFFQEDNVYLAPVGSNRRGIFFVGECRGPMETGDALKDARVAALEVISLLMKGLVPGNPVSRVDPERCAFCLTCYRVCPHGAILFDYENQAARVDPDSCQGCGSCASECPGKAIQLEQFEDEQILALLAGAG